MQDKVVEALKGQAFEIISTNLPKEKEAIAGGIWRRVVRYRDPPSYFNQETKAMAKSKQVSVSKAKLAADRRRAGSRRGRDRMEGAVEWQQAPRIWHVARAATVVGVAAVAAGTRRYDQRGRCRR